MRFVDIIKNQVRFWFLALIPVAALVAILFLAGNIVDDNRSVNLDLGSRLDVPQVRQMGAPSLADDDSKLRVAIAAVLSPGKTMEHYQDLLDYMGEALGVEVTLILRSTYAEVNDEMKSQKIDIAFVCTLAYVDGDEDGSMELLLAPQMFGGTEYYSFLIVPRDSSAKDIQDLRGKTFAYTDPLSNSGYMSPLHALSTIGESPLTFFTRTVFTYGHDNSMRAVADGLIDGAAVDSLVYEQLIRDTPELAEKIKVIGRWGPYGIPPVVIHPDLEDSLKTRVREFLLSLDKTDKGRAILEKLSIDRFVIVDDSIYDTVRQAKRELGW